MKKILVTIFLVVMILTVAGVAFVPQPVEASWWCVFNPATCVVNGVAEDVIMGLFSQIGNAILSIMSWFLTLAGLVLNISILLTMNIKAIYQATPAIEQVWVVIRNLSSIFIIFFLLYTSIRTILGGGTSSVQKLVGKIIMAGLLINFSLFFTKVAIDASNLVSLQLYRAIAPQSQNTLLSGGAFDGKALLNGSYLDGGISNIFQQSLKIPTIFNNKKGLITGSTTNDPFKIAVSTISGSLLMLIAALSFLAASIAFVIRLVILLILMSFSPVYFAGMIFPEIENKISKKWLEWLTKELVFMPVYLVFMYVAMSFLGSDGGKGFFAVLDVGRQGAGTDPVTGVLLSSVGLLLQFTIAFILINIPLYAALQTGGVGAKWGNSAKKWVGGYVGKNTVGRAASKIEKKIENTKFGNFAPIRDLRSMTTQKAANSKFGGYSSRKDDEKDNKERAKKGREIEKVRDLKLATTGAGDPKKIKEILRTMSSSEIANLDKDMLTHAHIVPHLSSAVYASVEKGEKSDKDKAAIKEARTGGLENAVTTKDAAKIKDIMKNMSGEELQAFIENNKTLINNDLIAHIRPSQLKDMDGLDTTERQTIGRAIHNWKTAHPGINHPAFDFVDKNQATWI